MATTAQAAALTAAYLAATNQQGALAAYVVAQLWLRAIDLNDIDASAAKLTARLIPLIRQQQDKTRALAREYYPAFRRLETGRSDGFSLPALGELDLPSLETSLRVTGPVALKKRISKIAAEPGSVLERSMLSQAMDDTATGLSGAATRHVMNGGRDEIQNALKQDTLALGYVRNTQGDPCYFCAMLASRGPVYDDDSFDESDPRFIGEGEHKVHDHCRCTVEPVYSRKSKWPGVASEASQMWGDLSKSLGRVPTINDWRGAWNDRAR